MKVEIKITGLTHKEKAVAQEHMSGCEKDLTSEEIFIGVTKELHVP